jgi:hypothetical protein
MPSLEEQKRRLRQSLGQNEQQTQQQEQGPGFFEQMADPYVRAARSFNVGLAQALGLPGTAAQGLRSAMGYDEKTALPTGQELQQTAADVGAAYEPGEEPDTLFSRIMENLGASALPIAGMSGAALRTGARLAPAATAELSAAAGGAAGGKALQATEWGQENPMLARAVGELGGGLAGASPQALGRLGKSFVTEGPPVIRALKAPMRGRWARSRAVRSLAEQADDPEQARRILEEGLEAPEEVGLTAAQKTGDPGIARLRRQVEEEIDPEAKFGRQQVSKATQELRAAAVPTQESAGDVQQQLQSILQQRAQEAEVALRRARQADMPEVYNRQARQKIEQAYDEARAQERQLWQQLPAGEAIEPTVLKQTYREELEDITAGGDIKELDQFVRKKLGRPGEGNDLVGGELLQAGRQKATPKELHQLYSRMGRRVRELAQQPGQTNKIRILNRLRRSVLEDLEEADVGQEYRRAINFSKELNRRFTSGDLGRVLGFERGLASPEAATLDELLGSGQQAQEAVQQVLEAAPQTEDDIKDFIRSRFKMAATNEDNNRIASKSGKRFLQQHRRLLNAFPDLKQELSEAVSKQKRVDALKGGRQVDDLSPVAKQRAAASLFLGQEDPGDAVRQIIRGTGEPGRNKTRYFRELNQQVRQDPTGKAKRGLQNAIVSELMANAQRGVDDQTGEMFISGSRFLKRLEDLQQPLKQSGVLTEQEFNRLRRIGQAFRKVETGEAAKAAGSITTDVPGQGLELLARVVGAQIGGKLGASSAGGSLQTAQIASGWARNLVQSLTNDEARNLLIRATRDDELMRSLLKDVSKMNAEQQKTWRRYIIDKAKEFGGAGARRAQQIQAPAAATTPAMVSGAQATQAEAERQELRRRLLNLSPGQ